jgi:hypothetical protein
MQLHAHFFTWGESHRLSAAGFMPLHERSLESDFYLQPLDLDALQDSHHRRKTRRADDDDATVRDVCGRG